MSHTVEHNTWLEMRRRCEDPRRNSYPSHGARGIKVCERWQSFENFFADMGPRPGDEFSIDRIDNDGNYEPGNCRWATRYQQAFNTSRNLIVTAFGKTAPLGMFVDSKLQRSLYKRAWKRITKYGWDAERALADIL
jgi:hypothetical protein